MFPTLVIYTEKVSYDAKNLLFLISFDDFMMISLIIIDNLNFIAIPKLYNFNKNYLTINVSHYNNCKVFIYLYLLNDSELVVSTWI